MDRIIAEELIVVLIVVLSAILSVAVTDWEGK